MSGLKIVKFPAPDTRGAKEVLESALKKDLTNVIVLSQRENGDIYHAASDSMTLSEINWIIDSYKFWLITDAGSKE